MYSQATPDKARAFPSPPAPQKTPRVQSAAHMPHAATADRHLPAADAGPPPGPPASAPAPRDRSRHRARFPTSRGALVAQSGAPLPRFPAAPWASLPVGSRHTPHGRPRILPACLHRWPHHSTAPSTTQARKFGLRTHRPDWRDRRADQRENGLAPLGHAYCAPPPRIPPRPCRATGARHTTNGRPGGSGDGRKPGRVHASARIRRMRAVATPPIGQHSRVFRVLA